MKLKIFVSVCWVFSLSAYSKDFKKESQDLTVAFEKCVTSLQKSNYNRDGRQFFVILPSGGGFAMLLNDGSSRGSVAVFSTDPNDIAGIRRVAVQAPEVKEQSFSINGLLGEDEAINVGFSCQPTRMSVMAGGGVKKLKLPRYSVSTEPLYYNDKMSVRSAPSALKSFIVEFLKTHPESIDAKVKSACSALSIAEIDQHLGNGAAAARSESKLNKAQ